MTMIDAGMTTIDAGMTMIDAGMTTIDAGMTTIDAGMRLDQNTSKKCKSLMIDTPTLPWYTHRFILIVFKRAS
jgi:hypothetical protein